MNKINVDFNVLLEDDNQKRVKASNLQKLMVLLKESIINEDKNDTKTFTGYTNFLGANSSSEEDFFSTILALESMRSGVMQSGFLGMMALEMAGGDEVTIKKAGELILFPALSSDKSDFDAMIDKLNKLMHDAPQQRGTLGNLFNMMAATGELTIGELGFFIITSLRKLGKLHEQEA